MKNYYSYLGAILLALLSMGQLEAQDFIYTPTNPAFGGDTFNYQWMLSSAQAQNSLTDPNAQTGISGFARDPLVDFQESLNRQILSQLSRQIVTSQFGEGALQEGRYELGVYQINIESGGGGINITILDTSTGGETTVVVPFF